MKRARLWKYPVDKPEPAPELIRYPSQRLMIAANPDDHSLPWAVILADKVTMFDFAELSFTGRAVGKCDWMADNYWFPKMWIEIVGELHISGVKALIVES